MQNKQNICKIILLYCNVQINHTQYYRAGLKRTNIRGNVVMQILTSNLCKLGEKAIDSSCLFVSLGKIISFSPSNNSGLFVRYPLALVIYHPEYTGCPKNYTVSKMAIILDREHFLAKPPISPYFRRKCTMKSYPRVVES